MLECALAGFVAALGLQHSQTAQPTISMSTWDKPIRKHSRAHVTSMAIPLQLPSFSDSVYFQTHARKSFAFSLHAQQVSHTPQALYHGQSEGEASGGAAPSGGVAVRRRRGGARAAALALLRLGRVAPRGVAPGRVGALVVVPPPAAAAAVAAAVVVVPGRAPTPVAAQAMCQLCSRCCRIRAQRPWKLHNPYCPSHATSLALTYHCRWSQEKRPVLQPGGLLTSGCPR